jgi:hypothetical protein
MTWPRITMALGALLLLGGFYVGTESPVTKTVSISGESHTCAFGIGPSLLVGDVGTSATPAPAPTRAERRDAAALRAACGGFEQRTAWAVWTSLGLGGVLLLAGFGGVREREADELDRNSAPVPVPV